MMLAEHAFHFGEQFEVTTTHPGASVRDSATCPLHTVLRGFFPYKIVWENPSR